MNTEIYRDNRKLKLRDAMEYVQASLMEPFPGLYVDVFYDADDESEEGTHVIVIAYDIDRNDVFRGHFSAEGGFVDRSYLDRLVAGWSQVIRKEWDYSLEMLEEDLAGVGPVADSYIAAIEHYVRHVYRWAVNPESVASSTLEGLDRALVALWGARTMIERAHDRVIEMYNRKADILESSGQDI